MNSTTTDITAPIIQVLSSLPDPKKDDNYRYYHCRSGWNCLKCKKVDSPSQMPTEENTQLLFVKSYIPERLDSIILKYKWVPDRVIIEKQST